MDPGRIPVAVIVPAKNEAARIGATVAAARGIDCVDVVVVVDDGSTDPTAERARAAGAVVVPHARNRGKGAAMETGGAAVAAVDERDGRSGAERRHLMFLDADLGHSAANAGALAVPVRAGTADMSIAVLPPQSAPGGGRGLVVRLSRDGIARATGGWHATQPLSGQRCLTREAFDAALPLAHGFGVETALTIDLLRMGFRVVEVPVDLQHRVTGHDWRAQLHRGRQYADVARALAVRRALPVRRGGQGA